MIVVMAIAALAVFQIVVRAIIPVIVITVVIVKSNSPTNNNHK